MKKEAKINRSSIFKAAWYWVKNFRFSLSEALKTVWNYYKNGGSKRLNYTNKDWNNENLESLKKDSRYNFNTVTKKNINNNSTYNVLTLNGEEGRCVTYPGSHYAFEFKSGKKEVTLTKLEVTICNNLTGMKW